MKQYAEYKDSRVEWIGKVPKDWEIKKNRYILTRVKNIVDTNEKDFPVLSLSIQGVIEKDREDNTGKIPAVYANYYQIVKENHLLLCLFDMDVTPCLVGYIKKTGIISPAYSYFEPFLNGSICSKYYYYWYLRMHKENLFIQLSNNVRNSINNDDFKNIVAPYPPLETQRKIADYLDKKIDAIDTLITDKQKLIDLLKEKRQAIISEAVTKGLDKNAKMKDSGIEWIGKVPEHWSIKKLSYITQSLSGGTPSRDRSDYWENGSIPWMSSGEINNEYIRETKEYITSLGMQNSNAKLLPVHTVMMALNGQGKTKGMTAILEIETTCNQSLVGFICDKQKINYEYLFYSLKTMYKYVRSLVGDESREGLSVSFLKEQRIAVPPLIEQDMIVKDIKIRIQNLDELSENIELQIEKLKEYRQSIISEAVTGKVAI